MSGSASRVAGGLEADLRVTWHERTPPLRYQHCDSYEPLLILARTGTSADGAGHDAPHRGGQGDAARRSRHGWDLLHAGDARNVPVADVLVERRSSIEHVTVHNAHPHTHSCTDTDTHTHSDTYERRVTSNE